jgi:hypothetical protein
MMSPKGKPGTKIDPIDLADFEKELTPRQCTDLLKVLQARFEDNMERHRNIDWSEVQAKLEGATEKLRSLDAMEATGGEPDVISYDATTGEFVFYDCSPETPKPRRNICYDRQGQEEREKKGVHPAGNAVDMATAMGIDLLTEEEYRGLQRLGEFDTRTSSWVKTPSKIRDLGGAIFCDRRYDTVFMYHNSSKSFYSSRSFRGALRV